jgi:hypothetical protein
MMATPLTRGHIIAQEYLRAIVSGLVVAVWNQLPSYDERDIDPFVNTVAPIVLAGQSQSVALTEAYLARMLRRQPLGVALPELVGASVRAGTPPNEVYKRPFINVWTALGKGVPWEDAVNAGRARAEASAQADVALSSRATFQAVQEADDGIYGYERVADGGACSFCRAVNGAYVKSADASPLHNRCGCSLEPLTRPHPRATYLPSGRSVVEDNFAIHQHGELGAYIGDPSYAFTSESDI